MQFNKLLVASIVACLAATAKGTEHIYGPGATYTIAEQDALLEIQERTDKADVKEFVEKAPRESWSVWRGYSLPRATDNLVRGYVPWYSLDFDIPGPNGTILYPKGFTFNPLQHVKYPGRIVVFKLDQFDQIEPLLRPGDVLIADSGDVVEAGINTNKHISILDEKTANRLGIRVVPSIVHQDGTKFVIQEIAIRDE